MAILLKHSHSSRTKYVRFISIARFNYQNEKRKPSKRREKPVPFSQFGRLTTFGGVALNIGMNMMGRSVKNKILGGTSKKDQSVLTKDDIAKVVDTLCTVRGAAMKVGQVLSLLDDTVIDPKIRDMFDRVRDSANIMPFWQTEQMLKKELGSNWRSKFSKFDDEPFAAASIGQVHKAELLTGEQVAVKVQYPEIERSIDSDIRNLSTLVRMWDIMPKGLYVDNLMRVVRRELFWEVDYAREAKCVKLFAKKLANPGPCLTSDMFFVPKVFDDLSTRRVLTMEFVDGETIEKLPADDPDLRNKVGDAVWQLVFNEVFVFRFMQTDPNWANFIYNPATGKIGLLDFGAARSFGKPFIDSYLKLLLASAEGDREKILERSLDIGVLTGYEAKSMKKAHVESVMMLGQTLRSPKFDFGRQDVTHNVTSLLPTMGKERLTPPPDESYSMHRKFAGVFLLATKLSAEVSCQKHFDCIARNYKFDSVHYTKKTMTIDDGNTGL